MLDLRNLSNPAIEDPTKLDPLISTQPAQDDDSSNASSTPHPIYAAADLHNINGSPGEPLLDRITDGVTMGVPATMVAAVNSVVNAGVTVANWLPGVELERSKTEDIMNDLSSDMGQYYAKNSSWIDATGSLAGALIPGTLGIKALKAIQGAKSLGVLSDVLGFAADAKSQYLRQAMITINQGGSPVYQALNTLKWKAILAGAADEALQFTAFETFSAATMHGDTTFDPMSAKDMAWNLAFAAGSGGVLGGIFGGATILGRLNKFEQRVDLKDKLAVGGKTAFGDLKIDPGTQVVAIADALRDIPWSNLNPRQLAKGDAKVKAQFQDAQLLLNKVFPDGDEHSSNKLLDMLWDIRTQSDPVVTQEPLLNDPIHNALAGLMKARRVTEADTITYNPKQIVYPASPADTPKGIWYKDVAANEDVTAYAILKDWQDIKVGVPHEPIMDNHVQYPSSRTAFNDGADVYLDPKEGVVFNPASQAVKQIERPGKDAMVYMDTLNGDIKTSPTLQIGDLAKNPDSFRIDSREGLVITNPINEQDKRLVWKNSVGEKIDWNNYSTLQTSARYKWSSMQDFPAQSTVAYNDIPVLERLLNQTTEAGSTTTTKDLMRNLKIVGEDGRIQSIGSYAPYGSTYEEFLRSVKEKALSEQLAGKTLKDIGDSRAIQMKLNVPDAWMEGNHTGEFTRDMSQYGDTRYLQLRYDVPPDSIWEMGPHDTTNIDGMKASGKFYMQQRIKMAQDAVIETTNTILGKDALAFSTITTEDTMRASPKESQAAGILSSANANPGTLGQKVQAVGKLLASLKQRFNKDAIDFLMPNANKAFQNPETALEFSMINSVARRSTRDYVLDPQNPNRLVDRKYLAAEKANTVDKFEMPEGYQQANDTITAGMDRANQSMKFLEYKLSDDVAALVQSHISRNGQRMDIANQLNAVKGTGTRAVNVDTFYGVPPSPANSTFHAIVQEKPGYHNSTGQKLMIFAPDAETLEQKAKAIVDKSNGRYAVYTKDKTFENGPSLDVNGELPSDLQVHTKDDIKKYHKARGDYDYQMEINETQIKSELQSMGVWDDYYPPTNPKEIEKQFWEWHLRQEEQTAQNIISTRYSQPIAELHAQGESYTSFATSRTSPVLKSSRSGVDNPYEDYVKTMLDKSRKSEYPIWQSLNDTVESLGSTAFRAAQNSFNQAAQGKISFEQANDIARNFGLGNVYNSEAAFHLAGQATPRAVVSAFINTANSVLSATTLTLDFMNSLVNIISTPILMGAEVASLKTNRLRQALAMDVPGLPGAQVPGTSRLLFKAIRNYFNDTGDYLPQYKNGGIISTVLEQQKQLQDTLALPMGATVEQIKKAASSAVDIGSKWTGNRFAEEFTRFISADVMRQILVTEGKLVEGAPLNGEAFAYINTFVNRVQGNYLASQRPIVFQGPIGQAIGLFQTYQFNMIQQLLRHVQDGDKRAAFTLAGLQSSMYGFQGMPAFNAINTHLIGNAPGNPEHKDLNYALPATFGKEMGNWLLYGTASAFPLWGDKNPALYSRGDINPRQLTVIPTQWNEIPAVNASTKFLGTLWETAQKIQNGGDVWRSMMEGVEHNGLNRPIQGAAQVFNGYSTTSKGSLIAANNDLLSMSNAARILGSRPFDESVALDFNYRKTAYQARDTALKEQLGEVVKTKLRNNEAPTTENLTDYMAKYTAAGGQARSFNSFMVEQMKSANQSIVNKTAMNMNTPFGKQLQLIMGGNQLPDFQNSAQPITQGPQQAPDVAQPTGE